MLQSHSQQTNENSLFSRILISLNFFYSTVKQAVLGLIPGGDQIFLILYCLKEPVKEREYF